MNLSTNAKEIIAPLFGAVLISIFFVGYLSVYMYDVRYYIAVGGLSLLVSGFTFQKHGFKSAISWAAFFKNMMAVSVFLLVFTAAYVASNLVDVNKMVALLANSAIYFGFCFSVGMMVTLSVKTNR